MAASGSLALPTGLLLSLHAAASLPFSAFVAMAMGAVVGGAGGMTVTTG